MVEIKKNKKTITGHVVSDAMDKTIVVETSRTFKHPSLHKIIRTKKKYKVHDEQEIAQVGDIVECYEGRPVSKTKYMYIARIIKARSA